MKDWLTDTEALTLKGQINLPYTWWVGDVGSRFLIALRDEKKILGNRCPSCNTVYVPPRRNCGRCFVDINEWLELSDEGVVSSYTIVRFSHELQPLEPPYAYAIIKLDGCDVGLVHVIKENLESLKNGARVKAVFKEDRTGKILDIDSFRLI
ncbi:MAG: Zn-ribbon domain-containing OB-fold protein [Thermodesulfobacteriota bacterium]